MHRWHKGHRSRRACLACLLCFLTMTAPPAGPVLADGPSIPGFHGAVPSVAVPSPTALPAVRNVVQGVSSIEQPAENRLVVHQQEKRAIVEWDSFDIGAEAWTHFDQQGNADWAALNRIYDRNPSQIYGRLTAEGRVYLINQNGIFFGPGSRVNTHSLTASSLNLRDQDLVDNLVRFQAENYIDPGDPVNLETSVVNQGTIETDTGGSVFLIAPVVENHGTIDSPTGQIGLAAGEEVLITPTPDSRKRLARILDVKVGDASGEAVNSQTGRLTADSGLVGMYGRVVNQQGLIRSVRALQRNGKIELCAAEKIITGKDSRTLSPVTDSEEELVGAPFEPSTISLWGLDLDSSDPTAPREPAERIEHHGVIEAPSGVVTLKAQERVYLEDGSRIDVSGLWVEQAAEQNLVKAQLNSVELADDFGQKGGVLQGETVSFNAHEGSAIGHVEGSLATEARTAGEMSTKGGSIEISATSFGSGELIVKEGAELDFSGGGFSYAQGHADTTMLLSGLTAYDISNAPQWIQYDAVMGLQEKRYERYGVTETFEGLYYGGAAPLKQYWAAHTEGHDAGTLKLDARTVVLDGVLDGSVQKGIFQTEQEEPVDEYGYQTAAGLKEPAGGTLQIGSGSGSSVDEIDFMVGEIVIKEGVPALPGSFGPGDGIPDRFPGGENLAATQWKGQGESYEPVPIKRTYLSAEKLSNSGLNGISLSTNTRLTIEQDAVVSLPAGGEFAATANSILHEGEVSVPAGNVSFTVKDNFTSFDTFVLGVHEGEENPHHVPYEHKGRILLADGSKVVAAGERVDNAFVGMEAAGTLRAGRVDGGLVKVGDETRSGEGIIIRPGALVDVSGGFEIDPDGGVVGGDAGQLELQALRLQMGGDLRGHALLGSGGGTLVLHTGEVTVVPTGTVRAVEDAENFVLVDDRLDGTGFTHITLKAQEDLILEAGATLSPSRVKLGEPVSTKGVSAGSLGGNVHALAGESAFSEEGLIIVEPEFVGASSVELQAGEIVDRGLFSPQPSLDAEIVVEPGAGIEAWPAGEISINAPVVEIGGTLEALSGSVNVTAGEGDLVLARGSRVLATGYKSPGAGPIATGLPITYTPNPAGEIVLEAEKGDVVLESGSLVDVSGSEPVRGYVIESDGTLSFVTMAGDPGSIEISCLGESTLDGTLRGYGRLADLRGGTLVLRKTDTETGMTIDAGDIRRYMLSGFDALGFESWRALDFSGSMDMAIGRSLALDAPEIIGTDNRIVALSAPWVRVLNSYAPGGAHVTSGDATLSLSAQWLDVEGDVRLSGFGNVRLEARQDIRLSECQTTGGGTVAWAGELRTASDLTMTAARIYPTTLSDFSIQAKSFLDDEGVRQGGVVTILPSGQPGAGTIYSAGGALTIQADTIDHQGFLAAPLGEIILCRVVEKTTDADGNEVITYLPADRVVLAEGSLITTSGDLPVNYGALIDYGTFWNTLNKETQLLDIPVETAPTKSVSVHGEEVVIQEESTIDVSGGGSVFAYGFQPGDIQGTTDPLKREGQYVILPDNSVVLPGEAVYLTGSADIPEGTYTLLPEEFAFLPGALVIREIGTATAVEGNVHSEEGYEVSLGSAAVMGTSIRSPQIKMYSVRAAEDVLNQGHFDVRELVAGAGGDVTLDGATTVLNGNINGTPLPDYEGGLLSMGGKEVVFGPVQPDDPVGKLYVDSRSFTGEGFQDIQLGIEQSTDRVTFQEEGVLEARNITLSAGELIELQGGAEIHALETARLETADGRIEVQEGALVHAGDEVVLDATQIDLQGDLQVDNSSLRLTSSKIYVDSDAHTAGGDYDDGLYLSERIWAGFGDIERITLVSRSDLVFLDGLNMRIEDTLAIDAARIVGMGLEEGETVRVTCPTLYVRNSGGQSDRSELASHGLLALDAGEISIGNGDIVVDGFSGVEIRSEGDLVFRGEGSLDTGADLKIGAARVTTSFYQDSEISYENADFLVTAGRGSIEITRGVGVPRSSLTPGGSLEMTAGSVSHAGLIEVASGRVSLAAEGTGENAGVLLRSGSAILARGSDVAPGGQVELRADHGAVVIEGAAAIDVSAGVQGDAGLVSLKGPEGGVVIQGEVRGHSGGGEGGSFAVDTGQMDDFSAVNTILEEGGFSGDVELRARNGDVGIRTDETVRVRSFQLVADSGDIDVYGRVDTSGMDGGGSVSLAAGEDLTLHTGSVIDARGLGSGEAGGEVFLSSSGGMLSLEDGSGIDVSGESGGEVLFRALREGPGVRMDLDGEVRGATQVLAEAVEVYQDDTLEASEIRQGGDYWQDTEEYMSHAASITQDLVRDPGEGSGLRLVACDPGAFHFVPGMEIRSDGDLVLDAAWDLSSEGGPAWRFGDAGEPGILTLRASGDLVVANNLLDRPTAERDLPGTPGLDSWSLYLVAGADLEGADVMAVNPGAGSLIIAKGKAVYTESGDLRFASADDTTIGSVSPYGMTKGGVKYNLATYDGTIEGRVGGDLEVRGGAIQSATGDILIEVGGDLLMGESELGSIRTLGERPTDNVWNEPPRYWEYSGGGDIDLYVTGEVAGLIDRSAWDRVYTQPSTAWGASYEDFSGDATRGLSTLGGGDLTVLAGGDFSVQAGTFGEGDLEILAGGNIDGRFLVNHGEGELTAMGDFGTGIENTPIEAGDARISVTAQGSIALGTVINPTLTAKGLNGEAQWNCTYSEATGIELVARTGDVLLTGDSAFLSLQSNLEVERLLPGNVRIDAGGDVLLMDEFLVMPSREGNLEIEAGGDIRGVGEIEGKRWSAITVSDTDPSDVYGSHDQEFVNTRSEILGKIRSGHAVTPVHSEDVLPVKIHAGRDLKDLSLVLPKRAEITAGRDIRNVYYKGQNIHPTDETAIRAGKNISILPAAYHDDKNIFLGIEHGGPGFLFVQAGGSIDLGSSRGIQSVANFYNPILAKQGSDLIVSAGYASEFGADASQAFFDALRDVGSEYSRLLAEGEVARAEQVVEEARQEIIDPFLGSVRTGEGSVDMLDSQINSTGEASDIFIFAKGDVNVGRTVSSGGDKKNSGIYAAAGGAINIFSGGDMNVNESRVMTFRGGDITAWTDLGNINAGRGSKTAISTEEPRAEVDEDGEIVGVSFEPPAVGSGIRTLTYDPDGIEGPREAPEPGDVYLFAPRGEIDAGEAGIAGSNVILGATEIVNAQNIQFSQGSVGVPTGSEGAANLGALAGAGSLTETARMGEEATLGSAEDRYAAGAKELAEALVPRWLDVKVIDFVDTPMEDMPGDTSEEDG